MSDDAGPVGKPLSSGYVIQEPGEKTVWLYAEDDVVVDLEEGR